MSGVIYREDKFIDGIDERRLQFAESLVFAEVEAVTKPLPLPLPLITPAGEGDRETGTGDDRGQGHGQGHAVGELYPPVQRAMDRKPMTAADPYDAPAPRFKTYR